jgi:hypothetical protein
VTTRVLGAAGLALYAVHATRHAIFRQPEHLLWLCNVAAVIVGAGLLLGRPMLNAIGVLWLIVGDPLWLIDLIRGGELLPTSLLTHAAGLVLGLVGLRRLGLPRGAWWRAVLAGLVLLAVTRAITPAAADVNLVYTVWPTEGTAVRATVATLALVVPGAVAVLLVEWALRRVARPVEVVTC